jgi:hypothetical protein
MKKPFCQLPQKLGSKIYFVRLLTHYFKNAKMTYQQNNGGTMENKTPVEVSINKVKFFEAKILKKSNEQIAEVLIGKDLQELQSSINIWLKCGKYSLASLDLVEREQVVIDSLIKF